MYRFFCSFCLFGILAACSSESVTEVNFKVKHQGKISTCSAEQSNLMFYLSSFESENKLSLLSSEFTNDSVALLGADCSEQAWQVKLNKHIEAGQTLNFELGVPFEQNHTNPLTAQAPLNVSEMFWSWQLGHKFFRLDNSDFSFHLGSTGCKSPSRLRPATEVCSHPNRFGFVIENFNPELPVILDLDKLLNAVDKTQSCMSEQSNQTCQQLFTNLQTTLFYQE